MESKKIKMFGIILAISLSIILIVFLALNIWTNTILNKNHNSQEIIIGTGKKQALLIYQPSNGDTTKNIGQEIAEKLAQDGYTVTINMPSEKTNYNINNYDLLVFGSPVYFGKFSTPLKNFMTNEKIENKNTIIFITGKFTKEHKEELEMKALLDPSNNIYTIKTNQEEVKELHKFMESVFEKLK